MRILRWSAIGVWLLLGCACSHVLSEEALHRVDPTLDYGRVKADPNAYLGSTLLLGGMLVDNRIDGGGTTLEVFAYRLDDYGQPLAPDEAAGRFLARTTAFLDPELYRAGALVTLAGTVTGQQRRKLESIDYLYPVFRIDELHLWRRGPAVPTYYDPYYPWPPYPYYYPYPYLYRHPYGPFWHPSFYRWP